MPLLDSCSTLGVSRTNQSYPAQALEAADMVLGATASSVPSSLTTTCTHLQQMKGTSQCSVDTGARRRRSRNTGGLAVSVRHGPSKVEQYTATRLQRYNGIARSLDSVCF